MNNSYGTVKSALVDPIKDVEIFYHYRPSRSSADPEFKNFKKVSDVSSMLSTVNVDTSDTAFDSVLPGMYNLNLPVSMFGSKGVYTIFIRPREYRFEIKDVGALAAYPDQKGIVIDTSIVEDQSFFSPDSLIGYRVEYFESNGSGKLIRQDYYRLITSNNNCEPVTQNLTSANTSSNGYRFNSSGTLSFITVTPSTSPEFKSNAKPYIGVPSQTIVITNTKFDPVMIEVEMVDHDIETLSIMSEGNVIRQLDNGRMTHYNFDNEIYKQQEFFTVKDNYTQKPVYEVKVNKDGNIDHSVDAEEIFNS